MSITSPTKITVPFANAGAKNVIPIPSQVSISPGSASFNDGFPPLTMTPKEAGGIAPFGADVNGILNMLSVYVQYLQAGGAYPYDAAFVTAVGGYPVGARLQRNDALGYWINTIGNNTSNPEAGGAGWVPDWTVGISPVSMSGTDVTLTALQYAFPIVVITGLLTANVNLILPNIGKTWIVKNSTTGAFTVTVKTSAGTGVVVAQTTAANVFFDGVNISRTV
jgi:hypothetical protein